MSEFDSLAPDDVTAGLNDAQGGPHAEAPPLVLEDQVEMSQQMIQQLLEMLGEAWATIAELKGELRQLYSDGAAQPSLASAETSELGQGVLIVDDSQILIMRLRQLIEQLNFEVIGTASSGEQAFMMLKKLRPRVIILDHIMPKMSGLEFLRQLRKYDRLVRVMVCSGSLTLQVGREFLAAGANELIAKPVQLDQFVRALKRCMAEPPFEQASQAVTE
jgi:CheY-like chemotaxis protein